MKVQVLVVLLLALAVGGLSLAACQTATPTPVEILQQPTVVAPTEVPTVEPTVEMTSTGAVSPTAAAVVMVTDTATLGQILTDDKGMTLYAFSDDTSTESMCTGTCAELWPPFLSMGAPTAGDGVDAMLLDTLMLPDGTEQVMYNGHPLYHYSGDMAPGETNGQDLQGKWYVVSPTGDMVEMPTS